MLLTIHLVKFRAAGITIGENVGILRGSQSKRGVVGAHTAPEFERWQVVFNPVIERALHGPGTRRGWNVEPAMLLRLKRKVFSPSVEYYGEIESINVPPRAQPEVHQLSLVATGAQQKSSAS
jgi:hypothetical protein